MTTGSASPIHPTHLRTYIILYIYAQKANFLKNFDSNPLPRTLGRQYIGTHTTQQSSCSRARCIKSKKSLRRKWQLGKKKRARKSNRHNARASTMYTFSLSVSLRGSCSHNGRRRARAREKSGERASSSGNEGRARANYAVCLARGNSRASDTEADREERTLAAMRAIRCRVYMYNVRIRIESKGELQPLNGGAAANFCIPAGGMLGVGSE